MIAIAMIVGWGGCSNQLPLPGSDKAAACGKKEKG